MEERLKQLQESGQGDVGDIILAAAQIEDEEDQLRISKNRDKIARELHEEEELSEEEIQKQLEKEEQYRMKKAVQAMRSAGEIERYNSLRQKEKNEDDRIEQHLLDLNVSNKPAPQQVVKKVVKTVTSMIDKKKVFLDGYFGGMPTIKQTTTTTTTSIVNEKTIINPRPTVN